MVLNNRGLYINAKKCLYERVYIIVPVRRRGMGHDREVLRDGKCLS